MKFKQELSAEDFELSHDIFCKKYRHQPNYFALLAAKKAGPVEEKKATPKVSSKKKSTKKIEE